VARVVSASREGPATLEVVIPVWNEQDVLGLLFDRLRGVFAAPALGARRIASVRYVFVDDGSRDRSAQLIADEIRKGLPAQLVRLSRNFGHQNAVCAGMDHATADVVAVIDADLQDPPELILDMVDKWREGYEVVYGERRRRRGNPIKVAGYWLFYRLVAVLADIKIPLDSGDFCLMDQVVVRTIAALPERLRFPRGLRAWVGFRQTGLAYDRPQRRAGKTKYTFAKLYKLATDGVASSSIRPLQISQFFSLCYLVFTVLIGALLLLQPSEFVVSPLVLGGYLLIISGNFVQVFCIYILGAYVGRTYLEVKQRPAYVVMEVVSDHVRSDGAP
jgi:polyisoprenyl-phosphate glycosyltransferase